MKSVLAFFLFAAAWPAIAQPYDFTTVDRFLTETAPKIPTGFEVLIVQNGQQLYWKQFGGWQKDQQAKIASATKWFSGAVILSLVDDGTLSLDDRASRWLPYMTGEKETITIRQLMSHTSGFGGEFPLVHPCLGDSSTTLDECARALAGVPLKAQPGTAFIYSGAGMQVAGRVAEVASGRNWQTLFRERIAQPLGMTSTNYEYEGPTQNPRISGGGQSTATDYMKFLTMLQQRGMYEGRRVLSSRAVDAMLADSVGNARIVETPSSEDWRYGIGNWVEGPLVNSSTGLAGWTPILDRSRNLQVVVGMQNALRPFQPYSIEFRRLLAELIPPATLTPLGITNAASYEAGPVVPGGLAVLFGRDLGAQITFNGEAATVLYSDARQVTAIVPASLAGRRSVEVRASGSQTVTVPVADSWPALFTADASGRGTAAALNQDGTLNTASSPAARGSVLQLFGTGAGAAGTVRITIGGVPAEVSYAGATPGLVPAVFQVNARVPDNVTPSSTVPVVVQAGDNTSLPVVTVSVR